ncbi:MAG: UDP-N-acetylmuramoyl-L-alanyl-D-glutamate--2,6-diaminopimelate ligase [Candidatus Rokuibacteriota bacterium]|nr:MAG: UDP-N-acetylmuramoyl-L-alanyl-D-glutamate--2,6-diaminopimelate ligase [Candidatus Rokubacteria bacterium]
MSRPQHDVRRRDVSVSVLLDALPERRVIGAPPATVRGLTADSRRVQAGDCFVAVPGFKQDARRFVPEAVTRGAALVVTEGEPVANLAVPQVLVPSARRALARLADAYHGHPSAALTLVGITGTNGKTTTSYLVDALLRARGFRTGILGTIQYVLGDEARPAGQTTPEALEIQAMLAEMRDRGIGAVAMEVSSHALALSRVDGLEFDVAVFTNLTQDHLDFHGTLDEYRRAKRRLFEQLAASPKPRRTAVVSADDPAGAEMVRGLDVPVLTFGLAPGARVRATEHVSGLDGIRMTVDTPRGRLTLASSLIGEHNVMNLLGAIGTGLALGLEPHAIAAALAPVRTVPGRFEQVDAGQPFLVVVDYAHTPDALERVLATARKITPGRLGVVFGCGGDRDRTKRPIMGEIGARLADRAWVTSDNPRSERPEAILDEVIAGVKRVRGAETRYVAEADRRTAIRGALAWAQAGDTIVIAGKGHETYQIVGAQTLPFDDRAVAREILAGRGRP